MNERVSYLKEAFSEQLNVWSMVGFVAAAAYTQHWIPLIVGIAAEAAYLTMIPGSSFYQRLVQRRISKRNQEQRQIQREQQIRTFAQREREAVEYLRWMKNKIYDNYKKFTGLKEIPSSIRCLDDMWESFVDFLDVYKRRKSHLLSINRQSIQNQIVQAERSMSQAGSSTRSLMERNVEILRRRLLTVNELEKSVKHVEMQLQSIENFFSLVNDQIVTMNTIDSITALDPAFEELLTNIEATRKILEEVNVDSDFQELTDMNQPNRNPSQLRIGR